MVKKKVSFKRRGKKFVRKGGSPQWYRPGHGRMMSYVRKGPFYRPVGNVRSQYRPRRYKYLPPPKPMVVVPNSEGSVDMFPISPTEASILFEYKTPSPEVLKRKRSIGADLRSALEYVSPYVKQGASIASDAYRIYKATQAYPDKKRILAAAPIPTGRRLTGGAASRWNPASIEMPKAVAKWTPRQGGSYFS